MKSVARRGFLRLAAAAGMGAAGAPKVAAHIGSSSFGAIGALHGGIPSDGAGGPWLRTKLTEKLWKGMSRELEELDRQTSEKCSYRVAGLDPDLYQRASGAHWWRAAVQRKRDAELRKRVEAMRWQLWPRQWG